MDENEQTLSEGSTEVQAEGQNDDTSGLLGAAIGAVSGFLSQVNAIQTDLLDEITRLENQLEALQILYDATQSGILDPEDYAAVLTGEATPPEINPDGGPS